MFVNLDKYGNTSAASVPIALAEAVNEGRVKVGDKIVHRRLRGRLHERRRDDRVDRRSGPRRRRRRRGRARRRPRPAAGRLGLGRPDPGRARRAHGPARARSTCRSTTSSRASPSPSTRRSTHDRPDRQERPRDRRLARHRAGDRHCASRPRAPTSRSATRATPRPPPRPSATIEALGRRALAIQGDARDPEAADGVVKAALEAFGKVDILVNNAGITRDDLIMRMTEEAWREVLETNLFGAFWMTKAVTRPMLKARGGRIVNITSVSGPGRPDGPGQLLVGQGRADRPDQGDRPRARVARDHGQRGRARASS